MAGPTKKTDSKAAPTVKNGVATVFLHSDVGAVTVNGKTYNRGQVSGRSWSIECSPEDARDLITRYEFAAASEAGVPLTFDEKRAAEDLKMRSNVEVGRMAQALAQLADERVQQDTV